MGSIFIVWNPVETGLDSKAPLIYRHTRPKASKEACCGCRNLSLIWVLRWSIIVSYYNQEGDYVFQHT